MPVIVIADTDGDDLVYRVVDESKGMSGIYREDKGACWIGGNPYCVYSDGVKDWCQVRRAYDTSVVVATVSSGKIIPYTGE